MRNLFIMGMLTVAAFMAGWFTINREGDRTTIEINKSEIREDARKAIDRGRDLLERVEEPSGASGDGFWDGQGYQQQQEQQPYAQPGYPPETQIAQQPQWQQPAWQNDPRYNQPAYPDYSQPANPGYAQPGIPPAYQDPQSYNQPQPYYGR